MKQFRNPVLGAIRLMAATLFLGVSVAHAQDATSADSLNSIQSIAANNEPGGKVVITVALKSAPAGQPAAFAINTPPRIVFDFPNTENGMGKSTQEFGEGDLRSANIVQAGNRTRLVVNLAQMLGYESRVDGNNLLITLQRKEAGNVAAPAHFAEMKSGVQQKHSLRDIDFHRGKNGEGRVQIDLSDTDIGIDIKQQGRLLLVDFLHTSLPRNLQRKLDVTDFGTPVQLVDAYAQGENVHLSIEPKGDWEYSAYQADNKFIIDVKTVVEDPNKLVKGNQPGYAGEKLTLNFQNISTREALSVIADFTGLNMVISDTVSGNLTLRLKDVPWDQALDIILQSKGLDMRKNGNVIQVAPREEIASKEKLDFASRQEIGDLEPLRTESFQLSYAKALDIANLLKNKDTGLLSKRGSSVSDLRTNTLFVQDTPTRLEEVRTFVKQLDVPVRQVMIEARFVEAGETFNQTLGGRLSYTGPGSTVAGGGFAGPAGNRAALSTTSLLPGAGSVTGGMTLNLFNAAATKVLTLELNASELDGTTKNIASPRVVTGDKTPATIESGVEVPYLQATSSGATSVAFKKAVLGLTVTPQITPDDHVGMKLSVSQDTVGNIYSGVPSINTKKVDTQVLVDNGGTVVIGGVYTQDATDSKEQIPLLGDIPILGWLFKTDTIVKAKKELLVFITPKIVKESMGMN
ncbi:type IV pilus secretin family protein [Sideroxydans lithotrophicus]|uniref:Type IV pilus biogenesis and competence protein PilQ n=1 Tax=Sideroxydans lithotrophicus (strain ES-1) TaxID=580332 RepID=D5CTP8_SIDLE|nr:type IV pilus secretin family protein [Sideroxydans lithotrophicus]ADE10354.1 type IV pilus secretin PilQ [Sideroxydans lithotrophicus ES-1]